MATWKDVVAIGKRLHGVEVGTWYGTPGLKVGGKGFCRLRTDPDALVIRVLDLGDRTALLGQDPDVFFITPTTTPRPTCSSGSSGRRPTCSPN